MLPNLCSDLLIEKMCFWCFKYSCFDFRNFVKLAQYLQSQLFWTKRSRKHSYVYVCICSLYFDLAWNSSIPKYSLIKAKLQLQNNDLILPTTSCTEVAMRTIEEHITSPSNAVVVGPDKKLSQYKQWELLNPNI